MFCTHCGTKNEDNVAFCTSCGTRLNPQPAPTPVFEPTPEPAPKARPTSKMPKLVAIVAAVVALVVALVIFLSLSGNGDKGKDETPTSSPEAMGKELASAYNKGNIKAIVNLVHKDVLEEDIGDNDDVTDYIEYLSEEYEYYKKAMEDWGYSITYSFERVDSASTSDTREIKEYYEEEYDLKVKEVKTVVIEQEYKDKDGETDTYEQRIFVLQIGSQWYLDLSAIE